MQLGMLGLGRVGGNIVRRLMRAGHTAVVDGRNPEAVRGLVDVGATGALGLEDLVARLEAPRNVWVILPAGEITETTIQQLASLLDWGDTIIDGGSTFWQDDIRRAAELRKKGIHYIDVGSSGGVWGLERGYCMMIGGDKVIVDCLDPIFTAQAPSIDEIPPRAGMVAIPASNVATSTHVQTAPAIS